MPTERLISDLVPNEVAEFSDHVFADGRNVFVLLDAALVFGLVEKLELHDREFACLVAGPDALDLGDALPWVIRLERGDKLLDDIFSDIAPNGLWSVESGIFIKTDFELAALLRHLRKFHRPNLEGKGGRLFLRFWEPELLLQMMEQQIAHIQALVDPQVAIFARVETDVYSIKRTEPAQERPGSLSQSDQDRIGLMLTARRRSLLATRIAGAFPDHIAHLTPRAIEREVYDTWAAANSFGLKNGQTRAKFIITAVALAPGLHRERSVERLFAKSKNPDQTFHDLEAVIKRRVGSVDPKEVS